jgi:putative NADH-flavin reductase
MKIIVFGATGGIGRLLVRYALDEGHAVTAFVRNPTALDREGLANRTGLRIVQGDLLDPASVADAIDGQRAVFSALGPRSLKAEGAILARALPHILAGMHRHLVDRIIVAGAAGSLEFSGKYQTPLANLFFRLLKGTLLRHPMRDQAAQERILAASDLDYTIVRPPRLTDGPRTGAYHVVPDGLPSSSRRISRADVAEFMLAQINDPRFHRQGVYIAD